MTRTAVVALLCAVLAVVVRIPLLWDDPWAPGYDGWYYVLQVRSWLDGEPLFADRSLVFPVLVGLARVIGDVVTANKVAACVFAAAGAGGAAVGAFRWTGSLAAALVAGTWWAVAPGHLHVSLEFLKNDAGVAVLGLLCAALPGLGRHRASTVLAVGLMLLGPFVHKLTGVMGLVWGVGVVVVGWAWSFVGAPSPRPPPSGGGGRGAVGGGPAWIPILLTLIAITLLIGVFGVLRGVDFLRFLAPQPGDGARFDLLLHSRRIHTVHRLTLLVAHILPILLAAGLWRTRFVRVGAPVVLLAVLTAAPLLPMGFDLTAWRLLLLAFIPTAMALALLVARTHWSVGLLLAVATVATTPSTIAHTARAEPEYADWAALVPVLQQHIPETHRVVAHRGLCGFVWAVADRHCENFDPQGDPTHWWRIVYGMGEARLAPYSEVPPVRLRLGYTLVPESAWRAFRADHADTLPLVHHPRNPYRPRPGFVYGPEEVP